jgi:hypothetical protein
MPAGLLEFPPFSHAGAAGLNLGGAGCLIFDSVPDSGVAVPDNLTDLFIISDFRCHI